MRDITKTGISKLLGYGERSGNSPIFISNHRWIGKCKRWRVKVLIFYFKSSNIDKKFRDWFKFNPLAIPALKLMLFKHFRH